MDLKKDFVAIQGMFLSLEHTYGPLKNIKHRGGKEVTILNIITEFHKLLSSKDYILENHQINSVYDTELNDIAMFLVVNTNLKSTFEDSTASHLFNIMPQLSPCLLANIIVGLDLSKHFCHALQQFSLDIIGELLEEMIPCLKKCKPKIHLKNAKTFLELIITKLSQETEKVYDSAERVADIGAQILLNLTGLHGDESRIASIDAVYEHIGYTIWNLLDLLLQCNEKNCLLTRIIEKLIATCCSIMMAVTIDVFCSWAECQTEDGQNLQTLIAERSYQFIEKYQKSPAAKELIVMLGTIAQKPKTTSELIYLSDVPKMISMINRADSNQKEWFTALLNTQVLQSKESMVCIEKWSHLCNISDVTRLLNLCIRIKNEEANDLVIKCASNLQLQDLILATTRHFYSNGTSNNLKEDIHLQLVLLFNKMKDTKIDEEFAKELHLLLLQNPQQLFGHLFGECLKNTFFIDNLKNILPTMKEIATCNNVGLEALKKEIVNNSPNEHNCQNYSKLFKALIEINFYSSESIIMSVLLSMLQKCFTESNYLQLKFLMEILNNIPDFPTIKEDTKNFYNLIFDIQQKCRCKFLEFNRLKQEIVKDCVDVLEKICIANDRELSTRNPLIGDDDDIFTTFYKRKLTENLNIFQYLLGDYRFGYHAETVAQMIKILPSCVIQEWVIMSLHLLENCGVEETIKILTDFLILLCQLVGSQETKTEGVECMLDGLRYCLQNFGIVFKECIRPRIEKFDEDVSATKKICRLLRDIPNNLKLEEGLSVANLLTDESLSYLKNDKNFACLVASIKEPHICQMLAQKILK